MVTSPSVALLRFRCRPQGRKLQLRVHIHRNNRGTLRSSQAHSRRRNSPGKRLFGRSAGIRNIAASTGPIQWDWFGRWRRELRRQCRAS